MQKTKEKQTVEEIVPKLTIPANGCNYAINLTELSGFIKTTDELFKQNNVFDFQHWVTLVRRYVLLSTRSGNTCQEVADVLLILEEVNFLFMELWQAQTN